MAVPALRPEWQRKRLDCSGTLTVHITSATGLTTSDWFGSSPNAYVVVQLGSASLHTSVMQRQKNPVWTGELLSFSGRLRDLIETKLVMVVCHEDHSIAARTLRAGAHLGAHALREAAHVGAQVGAQVLGGEQSPMATPVPAETPLTQDRTNLGTVEVRPALLLRCCCVAAALLLRCCCVSLTTSHGRPQQTHFGCLHTAA